MKKFSKLNESVKFDISKIEDSLKRTGLEYKIFDYFYIPPTEKRNIKFIEDIKRIVPGANKAKIVLLNPEFDYNSIEIENYHENLKFNSSGFYFLSNPQLAKEQIDKVFSLLSELKEYKPQLEIKDHKFVIYFIGEEVTESDLNVKLEMEKAYDKLYHGLQGRTDVRATFWKEYLQLTIEIDNYEDDFGKIIGSLCTHLINKHSGYHWMKDEPRDEDLEDLRDIIREMGFYIEFKSKNDDITLKLVEA